MSEGLPRWHSGKESACRCRRFKRCGSDLRVGRIPWSQEIALHSSILAWEIPWAEEPRGVLAESMGSPRFGHDCPINTLREREGRDCDWDNAQRGASGESDKLLCFQKYLFIWLLWVLAAA